nr:MAG TPA: ribonucleotide-diphosphate reductase subunit alpha [Caudoviricetes sp.]
MHIEKQQEDFYWLNEESKTFLSRGYIPDGMTVQQRYRQIADAAENILKIPGFSDKFYNYLAKGYYSLSSPIIANFGLKRALPISCFGSYITDDLNGIFDTVSEVAMMNKLGGGTSGYFGAIRARGSEITAGGKSNGTFSFLQIFDKVVSVVNQNGIRRGMFAGYIDIDHADIEEWVDIHTEGNPVQDIYWGVNVTNSFIEKVKNGDKAARNLWAKILSVKTATGIPYLHFIDNVNENKADVYLDKNMKIHASNMCMEISLPSSADESFVCCLMSMNLLHYDKWKDTDAVKTAVYFLDAVMSEFIEKAKVIPKMEKAVRFAERHRALGLGVLGWHSYLQSHMIPFDGFEAMMKNAEIFKHIREESYQGSKELAELLGEPELLKGYGRRNTTLMAVAPTKSSSFILGQVSQGVEPIKANLFIKDTAKVKTVFKNPFLEKLLIERDKDTPEVWESINKAGGSVAHLDFLTPREKDVFKTFEEINQMSIIQQAAQRQQFIDQGQSINLSIHPDTPLKDINALYLQAMELGVKGIYYQFSKSAAQSFNRELLQCSSCEA